MQRIVAASHRGVLAVTGGGSQAISDLLAVPGASQCVLEARVPYAAAALAEYLGAAPEQYCTPATARAIAMASFWRAVELVHQVNAKNWESEIDSLWGCGATASLKTDRPKRGEHRLHVAVQTASMTETFSIHLQKDARSRAEEERLTADVVLMAIASAAGLESDFLDSAMRVVLLRDESLERTRTEAKEDWRAVMLGEIDAALVYDGGNTDDSTHTSGVLFPGAFHPLHHGHRRMAQLAEKRLGRNIEFELSIENVDKPLLDYTEISQRLKQFSAGDCVWLTRAPTFVEKSRIFPGSTFVVGTDTIARIADPRYYSSEEARDESLAELAGHDCHFLVFGRLTEEGFRTLSQLSLPEALMELCEEVSADEFRDDVSSTAMRLAPRG